MSTTKKLTAKQLECLRELAKPGSRAIFMSGLNAYWFCSGSHKIISRQMWFFIKHRLVDPMPRKSRYTNAAWPDHRINAAGRKALKEASRA